jgi:hypothetical protein
LEGIISVDFLEDGFLPDILQSKMEGAATRPGLMIQSGAIRLIPVRDDTIFLI